MSDELDTIVAADNDKYMIRCENLVKIYKTSDVEVVALQGKKSCAVSYGCAEC